MSIALAVFGFFVLLPIICYGIWHEDEWIEFEDRLFGRNG